MGRGTTQQERQHNYHISSQHLSPLTGENAEIYPERTDPGKDARLSREDALELLTTTPLADVMQMAEERRHALHGKSTYIVHSLNLNPTNICENRCDLCAFWRNFDDTDAYTMSLEAVEERLRVAAEDDLTDLHVVGGVTSGLDVDYYERLFRMAKTYLPNVCIQGLTGVEIHDMAERVGQSSRDILLRLKEAGLDAVPGGGAEIFSEHVRRRICPNKISPEQWLNVHREAHETGLATNATMLFGHVEQPEDIIDHMERLRHLQDRTGGFRAFIPLPFHPQGTNLDVQYSPTGYEIVRTVAVARLFLDNVPHLRVLANYFDRKLLEVLARSGVNDLGGTNQKERIVKAAGAPDDHRFVSLADMYTFVRRLGLEPQLVNSMYKPASGSCHTDEKHSTVSTLRPQISGISVKSERAVKKAETGTRLTTEDAVTLHDNVSYQQLGSLAHDVRSRAVSPDTATFVVDRNLSLTNVCTAQCRFCAFHVKANVKEAFTLSIDNVVQEVRTSVAAGATQVLIQGGLNPDLSLSFYEELFSAVKQQGEVCVHSLSPPEIAFQADQEGLSEQEVLTRLKKAGLDSLPGGGAEILADTVRKRVSPQKINTGRWLAVMRTAHMLGLPTTATMVFGLGETMEERVEHLMAIRNLQDETGGFTAFIPWSFQATNTDLDLEPQTSIDYLRVFALARLVLDNVPHLQAGWVTEGPDVAQLALWFGADDFGGVLMDEQVVRAAGTDYAVNRDEVVHRIRRAGFQAAQRTTQYIRLALY